MNRDALLSACLSLLFSFALLIIHHSSFIYCYSRLLLCYSFLFLVICRVVALFIILSVFGYLSRLYRVALSIIHIQVYHSSIVCRIVHYPFVQCLLFALSRYHLSIIIRVITLLSICFLLLRRIYLLLFSYEELNKPELILALDKHLRLHQNDLQQKSNFEDYYKRLSQPGRGSSTKRHQAKVEPASEANGILESPGTLSLSSPSSPDQELRSSVRRRTTTDNKVEEPTSAKSNSKPSVPVPIESPSLPSSTRGRRSILPLPQVRVSLPNGVSSVSGQARKRVSDSLSAISPKPLLQAINTTRDFLSDLKIIQILVIMIETSWIFLHLLPVNSPAPMSTKLPKWTTSSWKTYSTTFPDHAFTDLISGSLWTPLLLWISTSIILPLFVAFFFNVGGSSSGNQLDYLTFSIARGLIGYIIYGNKVSIGGLLDRTLIMKVNSAYPGRWIGMIITASLEGIESLYHAILTS